MNRIISLFLFIFVANCLTAQYNSPIKNKVTLGVQTTADGLIWRGVAATDTLVRKPSIDTMAYMVLDTTTNIMWHYKKQTSNAWLRLNLLPSDTASFNYVNTYGPQTVNGAKTFTTGPIISNSTNGDPNILRLSNTSTGTSAQTTMYILNENTNADGLFLGTLGTSFTTIGGFVQDAGMIGSGANLSGGLSIMTRANQPMRFYTNGHTNERMRIAANGNIGIANNNPSEILDINGERFRINSTTNNAGFFLSESGTNKWSIATVNGDFTFYDETNSIFRFIVKANGNVGIGTTVPEQLLELSSNNTTGGQLLIESTGAATSNYSGMRFKIAGGSNGGYEKAGIFAIRGAGGFNDLSLIFATNTVADATNVTSANERMRIASNGDVGIGISNPTFKLDVAGTARFTGSITSSAINTLISTGGSSILSSQYTGTNGNWFTFQNAGGVSYIGLENSVGTSFGATPYNMLFQTPSNRSIEFLGQSVKRMIITSGDEVLIGYTTDQGAYKLQVKDSVYVGGNVSAAAYTTRSDYNLKDDIFDLKYGLNDILELKPVEYTYKSNGSKQLGFIAQDIGTILPEVVSFEESMSVNYQAIIPILTKAIQEQQVQIEALKQEIIILKNK